MPSIAPAAPKFRFAPILTATVITVLLLWLFGSASEIFLLLFGAILISLYLGAVADFITRRTRLPRQVAFLVAVFATLALLVGLVWLLVPPVIEQTQALFRVLPTYIAGWESRIEQMMSRIPGIAESWKPGEHRVLLAVYEQVSAQFQDIVPKLFGLVHAGINLFSVIIMSLYLGLYPGMYREWLIALFPPVHRDLVRDVLGELASELRNWIVAQLTAMFILAVLTAIGLYFLDVPYWLTFGIFTGAVAIVPFFGTLVSSLLPAVFVLNGDGFGGFGPGGHATIVIILGFVIHIVEANFVVPILTQREVKLPPVLTILSVLISGLFLGPGGLLVAVPLLVVIMVVVRRILVNRIYEGQGFRRTPRGRTMVLRVPAPEGGVVMVEGLPVDLIALAERAGDSHRAREALVR